MRIAVLLTASLLAVVAFRAEAFDAVLQSGGATLYVHIDGGGLDLAEPKIVHWIQHASDVVSDFYGRFPTSKAYVAVIVRPGKGVGHGTALGEGAAVVNVEVGSSTDDQDLRDDWVLVHELIHLAFPKVPSRHHWVEEGLAVYVESVARAQAGDITPEMLWRHFATGMSNGLPEDGDGGLDNTPTWGRVYWGGALFFLLADIRIIERSGGGKSLKNGLRAIIDAGFDLTRTGELLQLFRIADDAIGSPVITELYSRMGTTPVATDLPLLWRRLGVELTEGGVLLRTDAELSAVRRAITRMAP